VRKHSAAALCHLSGDIDLLNSTVRSIILVRTMESDLAMRLRTLIELLAALTLTFAALVALSRMARANGMKVENAYACATIGEAKTGAVYMTLNNEGSESDRLHSATMGTSCGLS
jgi:hypothetical protein